jgi:hypothetical protein
MQNLGFIIFALDIVHKGKIFLDLLQADHFLLVALLIIEKVRAHVFVFSSTPKVRLLEDLLQELLLVELLQLLLVVLHLADVGKCH